jgi:hypothetical protein
MASAKKRTPQVEELRPYVEGVGKYLTDKLYGPDGPAWGTKLADIEAVLRELRDILTEKVLAEALTRQAATHDQRPLTFRSCPGCQEPITCRDQQPRQVATDVGQAHWAEPEGYCRRCRQAFFPSEPEPGHRSESVQPDAPG